MIRYLGYILACSLCAACAVHPAGDAAAPARGTLPQPTTVPGNWTLATLPLPPLDAIVRDARPNAEIYGVYAWLGEYRDFHDSIKSVGWKFLKFGGDFDDQCMRLLVQDDIRVMRQTPDQSSVRPKPNADPKDDDAFIQHYIDSDVVAFLKRYGKGGTFFQDNPTLPQKPVDCLEIWTEPNFQYLIQPDKRPEVQQYPEREALYSKLLVAAYAAAKKVDPTVTVAGFGAGGVDAADLAFIQHCQERDPALARSYDAVSTHPYLHGEPPEAYCNRFWGRYSMATSLQSIRQNLAAHGRGDTPIWYTELGWEISKADGGHYDRPASEITTPQLQAACICRTYAYALRLGVAHVIIMFTTDTDNYNGGFFTQDGQWRPSAYAVQNMIRLMPAPKLLGAISDGDNGYFAYRFAPGPNSHAREVIMLWNVAGPKQVDVPLAANATLVDMLGHRQPLMAVDGKAKVEVGPLPVYIQLSAE